MKAIRVTLRPKGGLATLRLNYNDDVHGLLYACWKERFPSLHDRMDKSGEKSFRPFTFSRIEGGKVNPRTKTINFERLARFEVRSCYDGLIEECARQLRLMTEIRLGNDARFELVNLQANDRLVFPSCAAISMRSPVTVSLRREDGEHSDPLSPVDVDWLSFIQRNTQWKAEQLGLDYKYPIQALVPRPELLHKQVTRIVGSDRNGRDTKDIWVTGWLGELVLLADPQIIEVLWYLGLGVRNSNGFGMFDILDDRPVLS